uniref:Thiamine phosphate synthase/TenI domain-containing protein n=1 Tax=Chromera velia CCMP2878 TaxID=1169474 RepID=A0A0G4GSQ6_9ALVE|eukprot:Cvel_23170.t1-p1 / transcript=Cvel_23170.t1 / gene=Cvel_23170 / organism=Chromera_velia_CCMP2878 / gene_product=Probable thiamine biosynthetic bifunctional enzyme, putative / transcript_product=Probable thiamine biosynthetic bifunctional enzyme, putative / location=Cvel_scaffold2358:20381-28906(+) / protein_length=597 / sequence_SO=supercontig / SO=protein_coding / is_pseudo=false
MSLRLFRRELKKLADYSLYVVTDDVYANPETLTRKIAASLLGGASCVQVRLKKSDDRPFWTLARDLRHLCTVHGVPLIVNNRADIALAVDADGLHIGQGDLPPVEARRLIGPDRILGITIKADRPETIEAALDPRVCPDYIATNAVFPTGTKETEAIGPEGFRQAVETLQRLCRERQIECPPVVAIGGIHSGNVDSVFRAVPLTAGIAAVSALLGEEDEGFTGRETLKRAESFLTAIDVARDGELSASVHRRLRQILRRLRAPLLDPLVGEALTEGSIPPRPLVHHMTNTVVQTQSANATILAGCAPLMTTNAEETEEIASISSSLVLNGGTLTSAWIDALAIAKRLKRARMEAKSGGQTEGHVVPFIFDPVGCGATGLRTRTFSDLVGSGIVEVIKGNGGEMAALARSGGYSGGGSVETRGVDSLGSVEDPTSLLRAVSREGRGDLPLTACMSGASDVAVNDAGRVWAQVDGGLSELGLMTGSGCLVTALQGCFAAAEKELLLSSSEKETDLPPYFASAVGGFVFMKAAARLALSLDLPSVTEGQREETGRGATGPGLACGRAYSFRHGLFDGFGALTPALMRTLSPHITCERFPD